MDFCYHPFHPYSASGGISKTKIDTIIIHGQEEQRCHKLCVTKGNHLSSSPQSHCENRAAEVLGISSVAAEASSPFQKAHYLSYVDIYFRLN